MLSRQGLFVPGCSQAILIERVVSATVVGQVTREVESMRFLGQGSRPFSCRHCYERYPILLYRNRTVVSIVFTKTKCRASEVI